MPYTVDCFACTSDGVLALKNKHKRLELGLNDDDIGALQCIFEHNQADDNKKSAICQTFTHLYDRVNLTRLVTLKLLTFKDPNNKQIQVSNHPLFEQWQQWQAIQPANHNPLALNPSMLDEIINQSDAFIHIDNLNNLDDQNSLDVKNSDGKNGKVKVDDSLDDNNLVDNRLNNDPSDDDIEPVLRLLASQSL